MLALGTRIEGVLAERTEVMTGFAGQAWRVSAPDRRIRVDLKSDELDAFLYVRGDALFGRVADDDGGAGLDARLCFGPSPTGEYVLVASGRGAGQRGAFVLSLEEELSADSCGGLRGLPAREGRVIMVGETVSDTLRPHPSGQLDAVAGVWSLPVTDTVRLQIDVHSDDFDPVVHVFGATLADSASDDDGGPGRNSRLCLAALPSRTDRIVVTPYSGGVGAYTLSVVEHTSEECEVAVDDDHANVQARPAPDMVTTGEPSPQEPDVSVFEIIDDQGRDIGVGEAKDGRLTGGDLLQGGGRRVQVWTMKAGDGERLRVHVASNDFTPFLYVVGPGLDAGLRTAFREQLVTMRREWKQHVWLCFTPRDVAGYRAVVSSAGGGIGPFTLSVDVLPAESRDCQAPVAGMVEFFDERESDTQYAWTVRWNNGRRTVLLVRPGGMLFSVGDNTNGC